MSSIINAGTSGVTITGSTSTVLSLATNGTNRVTIDTSGNLSVASGNLTFSGTGQRITGDMSNATVANRLALQNSVTNGASQFLVIPNGTSTTSQINLESDSAVANGTIAQIIMNGTTDVRIASSIRGSGTYAPMAFYTGGSERMRLDTSGNLGIGRAPIAGVRLIARGADTGSANYALICYDSADQILLYARNDGYINTGTRTNSPYNITTGSAANMFVDSTGGLLRSTSSLRYKSDVADATHGLADVLKLRSVTYKGINDGDKVFGGLIAEEVHDAGLTEFVAYDNEGRPDALHYGNMVALLVKAVQEQQEQIKALQDKIAILEPK